MPTLRNASGTVHPKRRIFTKSTQTSDVLVSVIVPVYQGEGFVKHAIRSALHQTHRNIEVLVVDDGSTDDTWSVLQSIDDRRVRLLRQENGGAAAARNLGLANSSGEYIAFLDADDMWFPHKLESELRTFAEIAGDLGIVYSWYYCVDDNGMLFRHSPRVTHSGNVLKYLLNAAPFIIPSASLFHRRVFEMVGNFDIRRRYHEDFAFMLRACRDNTVSPARQYSAIYKQSMRGKARRVMRDYDMAVEASQSIAESLRGTLSSGEIDLLMSNLRRELYLRFLMYGFNSSAIRLATEIPPASLLGGAKGLLGWCFVKTKINLILPTRIIVQLLYRLIFQMFWRRKLKRACLSTFNRK